MRARARRRARELYLTVTHPPPSQIVEHKDWKLEGRLWVNEKLSYVTRAPRARIMLE